MTSIAQKFHDEQCRSKSILGFAKEFHLAKTLEQANICKAQGVGVLTVFIQLLTVAFSGVPLSKSLANGKTAGAKDVFYRFMNSTSANWMKFIRLLSSQVIARVMAVLPGIGVIILDDTIYKRDRSKKVELLAHVRDHNDGRYYSGFRCLTLCFNLGKITIPIDFQLFSSCNEKARINGARPNLDKRTNGYKLRQSAMGKSFQSAIEMIGRQRGLVRHVLFDSWFSMPVMFKSMREMDFHGVGMLKTSNNLYRYKGRFYKLESLFALVKPFLHRDDSFASMGVELRDGTPFSITFVQDSRRQRKRGWLAIGTTDLTLSSQQVISLYSRRWNIEVFFKTVKSYLGFARECQSRSFDAIVCSVAVVFTRHMILTWVNLGLPTPETDGQLFLLLFDEIHECSFPEALNIVLREIASLCDNVNALLDISLRDFIATLPQYFNTLKAVS